MLNVIVPLNFSQTSLNAAHYAANMYKGKAGVTLILYHYYKHGEDTETANNYLISLSKELSSLENPVETQLDSGDNFIDSLAAFSNVKRAFMLVMGLTAKTEGAHRFSESNTLKMAEKEICPVLIVPEEAAFNGISNALISSNLKFVEDTPTLLAVKSVLRMFQPAVHILNVNSEHYIELTPEIKAERNRMEVLLADFKPEFYFMRLFDFHESIEVFAEDKNIDLIIIAPKYHTFYERLFKTHHANKLVYQSKVPVLAVHE